MKKIILLALAVLMMVGCGKRQRATHKYEVLLSTKDTMYVDAWRYFPLLQHLRQREALHSIILTGRIF